MFGPAKAISYDGHHYTLTTDILGLLFEANQRIARANERANYNLDKFNELYKKLGELERLDRVAINRMEKEISDLRAEVERLKNGEPV